MLIFAILAGCAQAHHDGWVEKDQLVLSKRGYPNAGDPCRIAGESPATAHWLDHETTLVACPIGTSLPAGQVVAQLPNHHLYVVR